MKDKTHKRWCSKHQCVHGENTKYNSCRFPNNKIEPIFKLINLYKPGTTKYYKDILELIVMVGTYYDGFNPKSAKQMKELVDDLIEIAKDGLNHKQMYAKLIDKEIK